MKINISDITGAQTPINSDNVDTSCQNMSDLKIDNIYYSASANPETNSIDVNSDLLYVNAIDCSVLNSLKNNRYCPYRIDVNNGNITLTEEGNGYINVYDEDGIIQFYANYSSPDGDELNEEYKSYVFAIKHDEELILPEYDNAYIYYNNYSYTYTEIIKPLNTDDSFKYNIYAYDYFINTNNLTQNIKVNTQPFEHECDNNYNDKIFVNEKSDTSYILKLGNGSSVITNPDNIISEEESSNTNIRKFKLSNIIEKSLQIDSTCLDNKSTEYYVAVSYSYLCKNEDNEYDGILHTDGLQFLSGSKNRYGVHVWGLEDSAITTTSFKYENKNTLGYIESNQVVRDSTTTGIGKPITQTAFHFNATSNLKNIISNNFNSYFNFKCNLSSLTNEIDDNTYVQSNIITSPVNYSILNNHIISIDSFINNNATQSNSLKTLFETLYGSNYVDDMILKPLSRNNYGQITFNYNIEGLHNGDKVQYANEANKNVINKKICVTQLPMSIVDKELELDIELSIADLVNTLRNKTNWDELQENNYLTRIMLNDIELTFVQTTQKDGQGDYTYADFSDDGINNNKNSTKVVISIPTIYHIYPYDSNYSTLNELSDKNYITIDTSKIYIATQSAVLLDYLNNSYVNRNKAIFDSVNITINGSVFDFDAVNIGHAGVINNENDTYLSRQYNQNFYFNSISSTLYNYGWYQPEKTSIVINPRRPEKVFYPVLIYDAFENQSNGSSIPKTVNIHMHLTFTDDFINKLKYEFLNINVSKSPVFAADKEPSPASLLKITDNQRSNYPDDPNYTGKPITDYQHHYNSGSMDSRVYNSNSANSINTFYPDDVFKDNRFKDCSPEYIKTDKYWFGLYEPEHIKRQNIYRGIHNIKLSIGYPSYNILFIDSQGNTSDEGSGNSSGDGSNNGNTDENNNENIENNFILLYRQNNDNNDVTRIQNNNQEYYIGNFILRNNTLVNINNFSITSIKITNNTGITRTLNLEDNNKVIINNYNTTTQELLISILYYSTDTIMTVTYEYIHNDVSVTEIDNINLLFS